MTRTVRFDSSQPLHGGVVVLGFDSGRLVHDDPIRVEYAGAIVEAKAADGIIRIAIAGATPFSGGLRIGFYRTDSLPQMPHVRVVSAQLYDLSGREAVGTAIVE